MESIFERLRVFRKILRDRENVSALVVRYFLLLYSENRKIFLKLERIQTNGGGIITGVLNRANGSCLRNRTLGSGICSERERPNCESGWMTESMQSAL